MEALVLVALVLLAGTVVALMAKDNAEIEDRRIWREHWSRSAANMRRAAVAFESLAVALAASATAMTMMSEALAKSHPFATDKEPTHG